MVLLDATTFLVLVAPDAAVPKDSAGNAITFAKERVEGLLHDISKQKLKIIIPTPALSEVFVRTDHVAAIAYLEKLKKSRHFRIEPFCERAAIEVAYMTKQAKQNGGKRQGNDETWAKIKYDRQIVAIAAVHRASVIYSDDNKLKSFAMARGFRVVGLGDLPVPDEKAQLDWVANAEAENGSTQPA